VTLTNLRTELPGFDTPALAAEWEQRVGHLDVPCTLNLGTRRILYQAIRAMHARDVLDIGTYVGTSALAFALAVGPKGRVVSIDTEPDHWRKLGQPHHPPEQLMAAAGVAGRVEFLTRDAREFLHLTGRLFDLICIDGWHEDFAVETEVTLALPRLNPGGLIYLDDVQREGAELPPGIDRIDGPRIALQRMLKAGAPFRVLPQQQTLEGEWTAGAWLLAKT
jgi:predicted O-methyltransferase YrrM